MAEAARSAPATVTAHTSAPGRTVLIEAGNPDGWLASDAAIKPPR